MCHIAVRIPNGNLHPTQVLTLWAFSQSQSILCGPGPQCASPEGGENSGGNHGDGSHAEISTIYTTRRNNTL